MGVCYRDGEGKEEGPASIDSFVWFKDDLKVHDFVIAFRESDGDSLGQIEFGDVCG